MGSQKGSKARVTLRRARSKSLENKSNISFLEKRVPLPMVDVKKSNIQLFSQKYIHMCSDVKRSRSNKNR